MDSKYLYMVSIWLAFLVILGHSGAEAQSQSQNPPAPTCQLECQKSGTIKNVTCALDPESMEGPFYLPLHLLRKNITEDRPGVPLKLHFIVVDTNTCRSLPGVIVDIWHVDAFGIYSGFVNNGAPANSTFLRGIQETNATGEVEFHTIYPGWYPQRCIHIHMEIFIGGNLKHAGQIYFPPSITELVRRTAEPYASRTGIHVTFEADDNYQKSGGVDTTFKNVRGDIEAGLNAMMYIGINPQATIAANKLKPGIPY